jgi:3-phenylpropionate/trans-cinnamate dioxygenase ferredoxin reductase component
VRYAVAMVERVVIVGAGQAASQAIDVLRRKGYRGSIALVGDEPDWPYQRPPLSKKYLYGALERDRLLLKPGHFYLDHGVQPHLGRRAVELDCLAQRVRLENGEAVAYDALLIATGSRPRRLAVPGSALAGVYELRTVMDADRIRSGIRPGVRLVVVGGGYIGLEVAATLRELGAEVTVLEMADRVMSRVVCEPVSAFYESEHARRGVNIVCGALVRAFADDGSGRVKAVLCDDGSVHPAEHVLIGVGVQPADDLAATGGIECSNGVRVDEHCRTSDPHVYAAGDCTNLPVVRYGRRARLESVDNAFEQGASAALNLLGETAVHDKVPWFWSDQYDLKLVIVGLSQDYDTVVLRGTPASRSFSACYLKAGELVAVDTVNNARDQMAARKLIAARVRPSIDKLADVSVPLRDCL